ncbi:S8 family serine peptidase [Oscillatoria sp. FACHB-1407]|uniref:S8 family peptidase n=1 Tax=Oscillatoria sp. FACHB-1407 TaxID=2692847 RepID=UPI001685DCAB|nr:S8 family serine peptidase [Oscillatoria sp. FACHB-1407]MBD2463045.1 S8 family serine peptidase [Oscillatoria sp. FACHB-1407]
MRRFLSSVLLTSCLIGTVHLAPPTSETTAIAQTSTVSDLYYTFYDRRIPLNLRQDVIAVEFRPTANTRGSRLPLYLQLQQDLQGDNPSTSRNATRGEASPPDSLSVQVEVQPLGERYALVTIPVDAADTATVEQSIRQQNYVSETLPVLSVDNAGEETSLSDVVLPNEILVSFDADLSNSQIQLLLNRYRLEIVRPLRFTQNRYLVRSRTERGTAILTAANQLNGIPGVQSATPNFIQALSYRVQADGVITSNINPQLQQTLASLPTLEAEFQSNLLPLAWHLNSIPYRGRLLPRTDIRATEAWEISNEGDGVVVAVIDSLIQWDHPDLANNLHTVTAQADALPGEVHGWDFTADTLACSSTQPDLCVTGDPDTRISAEEVAFLRPHFQNTFRLSDADLLETYPQLTERLRTRNPELSNRQAADWIRNYIRGDISAEFHGTWSAGVIAAQPHNGQGAIGVAPKAQILPVRVFGLGGEITAARLIEAIAYAASRDVDVINMSLGGLMPDQGLTDQIFQVLDANPNLIIVASAGNDAVDGVGFPAAIPGVVSVGATNLEGKRTFYSNYGGRLDVVAPGGETTLALRGGILTTGGTWVDGFWQNLPTPESGWGAALDPTGQYVQVQGTSFSAPTVSGVVALMRGVNPNLNRDRLTQLLKNTASYEGLTLAQGDANRYRLQRDVGLTLMQDRLSGIFPLPQPVSAEQYFFGRGLVNAEAAVRAARR